MIGQVNLLPRINGQIRRDKFPRFAILIGERGSGRKLLAREIAKKLEAPIVESKITVEAVREVIDASSSVKDKIVYLFADVDNMSTNAVNALLKVTEEPPQNAYFILTCESIDNLLPTIKSRGVTYMLEPYTYEEKCDYVDDYMDRNDRPELINDPNLDFMLSVASTPGELDLFFALNSQAFKDYIELVVDNVAEVSGSNAFKIAEKLALKDEPDKYNLKLFWRAFNSICVDRMRTTDNPLKYARAVAITGDSIQQLGIRGINKQMLFDSWLLNIREEWYDDSGSETTDTE